MPKASPLQSDFSGGEFSPYLYGRVDAPRYKTAMERVFNYLPMSQGGMRRRPGTRYVNNTRGNGNAVLVPFKFSSTEAYVLEFTREYDIPFIYSWMRVYKDRGSVIDPETDDIYEIQTPLSEFDPAELRFVQSADVLYIVHPNLKPQKLIRYGDANWVFQQVEIQDGPYLPTNNTDYTLIPSAATGTNVIVQSGPGKAITNVTDNGAGDCRIACTAHGYLDGAEVAISDVVGTTNANVEYARIRYVGSNFFDLPGVTFNAAYVSGGEVRPGVFGPPDQIPDRHLRMREGSVWGWGIIVSYLDSSNVVVNVKSTFTNTNAKDEWRLGVFSTGGNFPRAIHFHEDRLWLGGGARAPQTLAASKSGDYENFEPSALADGVVADDNALTFTLNSSDVNTVLWMASDEKGLAVGTTGSEWVVSPSSTGGVLTPSSINARQASAHGSADVPAITAGKAIMFAQQFARKLREMTYFFDVDGFRANDLTALAEQMSQTGIRWLAYQREPDPQVWAVKNDGSLARMNYERDVDGLKVGWSRHELGGTEFRYQGGIVRANVESIAVIPSPDGSTEDVWLVVNRYVNGGFVRHVEFIEGVFDDTKEAQDAFFVDSGLTYDNPLAMTIGGTPSAYAVTDVVHEYSVNDFIMVAGTGDVNWDNKVFQVAVVDDTTIFTFKDLDGNLVPHDGTALFGYVRKMATTLQGLDHLEGEEVAILVDGANHRRLTVTEGAITLDAPAAVVHAGLPYKSQAKTLRPEAGSADGTALGKTRRTHRITFMLHRMLGLKYGRSFEDMYNVMATYDIMSEAPPLYSGVESLEFNGDYNFDNQICWEQEDPLPGTILAVGHQLVTQDRG